MKTQIVGLPQIEVQLDGSFLVVRGFTVCGALPDGRKFHVEVNAGFKTDFASIPRFFWRVLPPTGRYSVAAVAHDYLYMTGEVDKADADMIFLILMVELNVPVWKRNIMFEAVNLFGKMAWKEHRKKDKK